MLDLLASLVTGKQLPRQAQFWRACKAHDICYWTLGKTKDECDRQFLDNLQNECNLASKDRLRLFCQSQCQIAAEGYGYFASNTAIADRSFAEAQAEAAEVFAALPDRLAVKDEDGAPDIPSLIGEACFWVNSEGKCLIHSAADWVVARVSGVTITPDSLD